VFTLVDHSPITLGGYVYPDWADGIGWLLFTIVVVMIPLIAVIELVRARHAHPFLSISVNKPSSIFLSDVSGYWRRRLKRHGKLQQPERI